ncbi:MAG: methylenetetrahydrofolate reductase [bacterium]
MHVTEHLDRSNRTLFSYEIIPPPRGKSAQDIFDIVEQLLPFEPPFIDVTSHSAEAYYEETENGNIKRRIRKKRPGTISICGIIQNRYNIDTVPHLLCRGFTREETEDAMIELNFLGINNVLAIRGDETNYKKPVDSSRSVNAYADELVCQLRNLTKGQYLDEIANSDAMNICIGVGGYPEKHVEAPNLKTDVHYLKKKVDAGADYIVTQMYFDNACYFRFVDACREVGIEVPIIPGLKIISSKSQLTRLPKHFNVNMPEELVDEIMDGPEHVKEIGVQWGIKQCEELLNASVPCIHFYIMNDAEAVTAVIKGL